MIEMTAEEELAVVCEQRDALGIECARLEKEVEALRKDAERYRWLRNDGDRSNSSYIARPLGVYGLGPRLYTHDALDAEIEHSRTVQRSCTTGTAMNGANA